MKPRAQAEALWRFPRRSQSLDFACWGSFFEQPRSPAPGGGAAAWSHPPPPSLARDSRGPVNAGEPGAGARGAPLRLIPGKDKEPPSHQLCLDSRPHKSSALFGLALQICQPDQPLKETGPATPFFPLRCHDCPYVKGSRAGLPAGETGLVRPVSRCRVPPTTHTHTHSRS